MEGTPNCPYCGKPMEKGFIVTPIEGGTRLNFFGIGWFVGDEAKRNVSLTDPDFDVLFDAWQLTGGRAWLRAHRCPDCKEILFNYDSKGSRRYPYPKSGKKAPS